MITGVGYIKQWSFNRVFDVPGNGVPVAFLRFVVVAAVGVLLLLLLYPNITWNGDCE